MSVTTVGNGESRTDEIQVGEEHTPIAHEARSLDMDSSISVSFIALIGTLVVAMGTLVVALLQGQSRRDIESIKLEMEKRRIAFEQEFQILSELWRAVSSFEHATINLRPSIELIRAGESDDQRIKRRFDEFQVSRRNLISAFAASRPFYPQEISTALKPIIEPADQEMWDLVVWGESVTGAPDPGEAIAEQFERLKSLSDAVQSLDEKIRARVLV
jgi:hypothetical protein